MPNDPRKKKELHWFKEWLLYGKSSLLPLGQLVLTTTLMVVMIVVLKSCK